MVVAVEVAPPAAAGRKNPPLKEICDSGTAATACNGKRRGVQKSREDILREKRERERERRKQIREDQ
nr:unnamed protein product [Callosobruchus chinensis]